MSDRASTPSDAAERRRELHVVLVEPEIPPNTGSIARLCAATEMRLHLVRPLGFSLDDRYLKRAGLDYWPHVDLRRARRLAGPSSLPRRGAPPLLLRPRRVFVSLPLPIEADGIVHLVFGGETRGLPPAILAAHAQSTYRIPIFSPNVRSLNLSNAVSVVLYEALRQRGALPER